MRALANKLPMCHTVNFIYNNTAVAIVKKYWSSTPPRLGHTHLQSSMGQDVRNGTPKQHASVIATMNGEEAIRASYSDVHEREPSSTPTDGSWKVQNRHYCMLSQSA